MPESRGLAEELVHDPDYISRSCGSALLLPAVIPIVGRPAMDFPKELRLQCAVHLLCSTRRPVKSIAEQVGFDSRSHFSRSFSDYFGVASAGFRETGH